MGNHFRDTTKMPQPTVHDRLCQIENAFIRALRDAVAYREAALPDGESMTLAEVENAARWVCAYLEWMPKVDEPDI